MKLIVNGRQSGKTTELFEWLARGEAIETEYCGTPDVIWNRGIVTINNSRRGVTKRALECWALLQPAFRDATNEELLLLLNAVYSVEVVQEARGLLWKPMREGHLKFAMDDAQDVLERYLGTPLTVATFDGEFYEREGREISPIRTPEPHRKTEVDVSDAIHTMIHREPLL